MKSSFLLPRLPLPLRGSPFKLLALITAGVAALGISTAVPVLAGDTLLIAYGVSLRIV